MPRATPRCLRSLWLLLCVLALALGCARGPEPLQLDGASLGTRWQVQLAAPPERAAELRLLVEAELERVDAQMSTWRRDSELSGFNAAPAGSRVRVSPALADVLAAALALARDTGGAFDPTVGPLVDLWGFGPAAASSSPPEPSAIEQVRSSTGWQRVPFDDGHLQQPGGLRLDLSGIAKGHAVDRIIEALQAAGVSDALVEVGGELRAFGRHPQGRPWRIGLEGPDRNEPAAGLDLHAQAVATSGDYRQFFEHGERRYSHLIDPRSGYPIAAAGIAVNVVHASCMQADALATALAVLGPDEGLAWAEQRGIAARFVYRRGQQWVERRTSAFEALAIR